ncbi:MAG: hexitol phosphatase HxpB [Candidatus Gracilibacteria bacterium]
MKIEGIIFDMDGLLIDSEPLWQEAEINSFKKVGINLTVEQTTKTTGLHVDEVVEYWYSLFPWNEKDLGKKEVSKNIVTMVKDLINSKGVEKAGVAKIISFLKSKNINNIAIASSSEYSIIETVINKFNIRDYFNVINSAQDEEFGKPHPGVYISTYKKMGLKPEQCLSFEDSLNGVISSKAAKVKCVAVPEIININNNKFLISDLIIKSLNDFGENEWLKLNF